MMFASNFWTHDYITGINTLVSALKAKSADNQQAQKLFASRVKSERDFYSLLSAAKQEQPRTGSMLAAAFERCREQTLSQAEDHLRISKEIDKYCLEALAGASRKFAQNVADAERLLQKKYAGYSKLASQLTRSRQSLYELPKPHASGKTIESKALEGAMSTLRLFTESYSATPDIQRLMETGKITMAGIKYSRAEFLEVLSALRNSVAIISYKVALLGTYSDVSTGASIASASRRLLQNDSIAYSEKFGQSLVDAGLLKPIAQISNKFRNAHQSFYQWQPIVAKLLEGAQPRLAPPAIEVERPPSPGLVEESEAYIQAVIELDMERCTLELEVFRVYEFLEACELERIATLKQVLFTFQELTTPESDLKKQRASLQAQKDELDPEAELAAFVRQYRSGPFVPNVATYESPNGAVCQSFGVDVRRSQFITPCFLAQLPGLPLSVWTCQRDLGAVYKLRSQVNTGRKFNESIFRFFDVETIAATLLQYYLELPDSLVPNTVYDAAKHLYSEQRGSEALASLVRLIPPHHADPLRQFLGYLHREYPDASQSQELGRALARYLFRPTAPSAVNMDDEHPAQFISDLLANFETVFGEHPASSPRPGQGPQGLGPGLHPHGSPVQPRSRAQSASSTLETTNSTSLIPLTLSPDVGATTHHSRPSSRLSFLPIGDEPTMPSSGLSGLGLGASPIKLSMRPPSTPASPIKPNGDKPGTPQGTPREDKPSQPEESTLTS